MTDTVRSLHPDGSVAGTVDRDVLRIVQTPQGFSPAVLRQAHAGAGAGRITNGITDDAGLVEALGIPVTTVPGDRSAFKITTPADLADLLAAMGLGYAWHALSPGKAAPGAAMLAMTRSGKPMSETVSASLPLA